MSSVSVASNSSVEVNSETSNDINSCKDDVNEALNDAINNDNNIDEQEQKFSLSNDIYKSLLARVVLGKTVLNRNIDFKENLANLKDNLDALKDLKDIKGLTVSTVPAFPRNLALHRDDDNNDVDSTEVSFRIIVIKYFLFIFQKI